MHMKGSDTIITACEQRLMFAILWREFNRSRTLPAYFPPTQDFVDEGVLPAFITRMSLFFDYPEREIATILENYKAW